MNKPIVRCAIYTRKSHEEGLELEFNSLDAQRQAGEAYIESQRHEGWQCLRKRYDDGGFTGGNMDRPALGELIDDIRARRVDCVVVYKVDRLSRSLLDFAKIINLFDEHQVSFVSVTQQFNTTTSMGRLTLNILLSFAQFEREVIGERIRDKKLATARQGKYIGGGPVLGLDVVDRKYVVNKDEAPIVRHIFELMLEVKSARKVAVRLNGEGLLTKKRVLRSGIVRGGKPWDDKSVRPILHNRKYIGMMTHRGKAFPGEHESVISKELFDKVQAVIARNRIDGRRHRVVRFSLLRGMLKCGHCGQILTPGWTKKNGREYHYYICSRRGRRGYAECPLPSLPDNMIETTVTDQLRALLRHPDVIARTYREVRERAEAGPDPAATARLDELRKQHEKTQRAIRAVLSVGDDDGMMADELKRLNLELKTVEASIRELETPASTEPLELNRVADALRAVDPVWDMLFPEERRRIVQLLVETITISTSGIVMRFRTNGIEQIVEELKPIEERTHA